jgi:hypothetical protein
MGIEIDGLKPEVVVPVRARTISSEIWTPPGQVAASAYADGEAIGGLHEIRRPDGLDMPSSGVIQSSTYWDSDDEGLQVDLVLFRSPLTVQIADHAAMSLVDDNLLRVLYVIQFTTFYDFTNGQISFVNSIGKGYEVSRVFAQARARGALNIAAGAEPRFQVDVLEG